MLEFIDRSTEPRFRANPELRAVAFWIGDVSKKELVAHLSPDDPGQGGFVAAVGDEWYDHDHLETHHRGRPARVDTVIAELADEIGLPEAVRDDLLERCRAHGMRTATAVVMLNQHVWDGDGVAPSGEATLHFLGNHEYEQRPRDVQVEFRYYLAGVTTAADRTAFEEYVTCGGLAEALAAALPDGVLDHERLDLRWHVGDLGGRAVALPPEQFFAALPDPVSFATGTELARQCDDGGVDKINAFISLHDDSTLRIHKVDPAAVYLGLREVGWLWTVLADG